MVQVLFEDTGIEIDGSQNITVRKRSYFHKLAQLLNRTPNRIIGRILILVFNYIE